MGFNEVKKILVLAGVVITVSLSSISPLKAQTGGGSGGSGGGDIIVILTQILQRVNDLPAALVNLGAYTSAWMNPDTSKPTTKMQGTFTELGDLLATEMTAQTLAQPPLNNLLLNNDGSNVYNANYVNYGSSSKDPATASNLPYANDLVYSTLLDAPFFTKDPRSSGGQNNKVNSALNYIVNASGLNVYHARPLDNWGGKKESKARYQAFYNTVMAATSFNGYALTSLALDKNKFTTLQQTLIKQATDPTEWFVEVGKENIGFVLRQLLVYQSQIFVLLTQMIQLQKQMITAQAMNTAVLIAVNQTNESVLVSGAKGENPTL